MSQKEFKIAFIADQWDSAKEARLFNNLLAQARRRAEVEILPKGTTEDDLIKKQKEKKFDGVFVPLKTYLQFRKFDSFLGMDRNRGPAFGALCFDLIDPSKIEMERPHTRILLIDGVTPTSEALANLLFCICNENERSGLLPFFQKAPTVFFEEWTFSSGLGTRFDRIFNVPAIMESHFNEKRLAIQAIINALWSAVYWDPLRHTTPLQALYTGRPKAFFQVALNEELFVIRLMYNWGQSTTKSLMSQYWPRQASRATGAQFLFDHADLVRVHTVQPTSDTEITLVLYKRDSSIEEERRLPTVWIDPIHRDLLPEVPFDLSRYKDPVSLATPPDPNTYFVAREQTLGEESSGMQEAQRKILELSKTLYDREKTIKELKNGGLGYSKSPSLPDAEALIEALANRLQQLEFMIRNEETQLRGQENRVVASREAHLAKKRLLAIKERRRAILLRLSQILESFANDQAA